jgi:hypothetical protein
LALFCGIDWATEHHDVAVVDTNRRVVVRRRVDNDAAGFTELLTLLAQAGDTAVHPIPVAIETVLHRHIKNRRLAAVGPVWALGSLRASPGAADTSMPAAPPETGTTKPNETCSTSSSANSTTASRRVGSTTNIRRFHLLSTRGLTLNFVRCLSGIQGWAG